MAQKLACAITHCRHEHFFLRKWLDHYGAILGRENLFVVLDGDDWVPEANLDGVNIRILHHAPRDRIAQDRFVARKISRLAQDLLLDYRFVLRTDADEFVCIDPATPVAGDWPAALREVEAEGYIYANGIDVVQKGRDLPPVDPARPILRQRPFGQVSAAYSKPFCISQPNDWAGGGHRLRLRPVRISAHFVTFHLALADLALAEERYRGRGGSEQDASWRMHQDKLLAKVDQIAAAVPGDLDALQAEARRRFPLKPGRRPARGPRAFAEAAAMHAALPERLWDLV